MLFLQTQLAIEKVSPYLCQINYAKVNRAYIFYIRPQPMQENPCALHQELPLG